MCLREVKVNLIKEIDCLLGNGATKEGSLCEWALYILWSQIEAYFD